MNHGWFLIQPFWLSIISIRLLVSKGCVWFLNQPLWFPNQPVVVSESWLVFESWLVSDSTVLVIDSVVLVTDLSAEPAWCTGSGYRV